MHHLTKSDFKQFLKCPEELWLFKNFPETKVAPDEGHRHIMEQGKKVDELGKLYFRNFGDKLKTRPDAEFAFQEIVEANHFVARADALLKTAGSNKISLIEVKATNSVKKEHIQDVAFQKMVFEAAGFEVESCKLVFLNKDYSLDGSLDLKAFFVCEDISDKVNEMSQEISSLAKEALELINGPEPEARIPHACPNKLDCAFIHRHFQNLPDYSVFDISRIHKTKLKALLNNSIVDILEVPSTFDLSANQRQQVDLAQSQEIIIQEDLISEELAGLDYPLYFLDYETFAYAIPFQDGHSPYQQLLFQYSLHIQREPGGEIEHYEYLLKDKSEPVTALLEHLQANIDLDQGSVIVWHKSFESGRNKEYAALYPPFSTFLQSINSRIYDLKDIFSKGYYQHPDFKGKTSIKKVLPVLCPDLSYDGLMVGNGTDANVMWHKWTEGIDHAQEAEEVEKALLDYCKLDTWAMVRIWEAMVKKKVI